MLTPNSRINNPLKDLSCVGTTYKVGDTVVVVDGNTITMALDGTNVKIGDEVVMPCVLEKSDLSAAVTVCENMLFLVVCAGLRCVRYVFCNLPLDFVFYWKFSRYVVQCIVLLTRY